MENLSLNDNQLKQNVEERLKKTYVEYKFVKEKCEKQDSRAYPYLLDYTEKFKRAKHDYITVNKLLKEKYNKDSN